ncbi:MAG: LPS-assembly protein LptD [Campylobacteraceae bacterium]|jgi:LPS-assembly protein|nr:LPS-assembly protein LptD [Campylobacteraceae bacterium]
MRKIYLFLFALPFFLTAEIQNVEFVTQKIRSENGTVFAQGGVVVYSEQYLITAERAKYNTQNNSLELFDNVSFFRGSNEAARSDYLFVDLEKDKTSGNFSNFFLFNKESKLWVTCSNVSSTSEMYLANKAVVSSCNVEDPDWKITFTSGELNKESSFLHLYNALFYAGDLPVFYLPYFAFPTDDTRRTGLLRPKMGYEKDEGLFFEQPFYFAPYDEWDLEIDPQVRLDRGHGFYGIFRFADSIYSKGEITSGIFQEKDNYAKIEDLKNRKHYGYGFFYDRSRLFSPFFGNSTEDGLMVDLRYLNDIDYLNLQDDDSNNFDRLVTSRLNYFLRDEKSYAGVYSKYFIDTDQSNNDYTLQEIPTLQYHKFLDSAFVNNIQYSIDMQYHNYYRKTGLEAQQLEFQLPATLYWQMFDDVLRFSVSENIYFMRVNYDGVTTQDSYGQYFRNYHTLSSYTDLAKAYENFFHKIYFGAEYIIPSFEKQKGYLDRDEFVPINTETEQAAFKFNQYFYNTDGRKIVSHTMRQPYYFEDYEYKYAPLENRIELDISPSLSLSNELRYSHQESKIVKSISYASYENGIGTFYLSHTYNKDENNNYFALRAQSKIFKNSSFFGEIQYDVDGSFTKAWNIGFAQSKDCWDYKIMYKEDIAPKLTSSGKASSVDKRGIYLLFNLYPLGGMKYEYSLAESSKDL